MQSGGPFGHARIHLGVPRQEHLRHPGRLREHRNLQRRVVEPVLRPRVHVRARVEQDGRRRGVVGERRGVERCPAVGSDTLDERRIAADLRADRFGGPHRCDFPGREPRLAAQDRVEDPVLAAGHEAVAAACTEGGGNGGAFLVACGGERGICFE